MSDKDHNATKAESGWAGVHDRKSLYFFIPFMAVYFGLGFYSLYEIKENWTAETDFKSPDLGNLQISSRDDSGDAGLIASVAPILEHPCSLTNSRHTALMFVAATSLATTFSALLLVVSDRGDKEGVLIVYQLIRFKAVVLLYLSPAFSVLISIAMAAREQHILSPDDL